MAHNQETNQSTETDPEITEITELVDDSLRATTVNIVNKLEDVKENINIMKETKKIRLTWNF